MEDGDNSVQSRPSKTVVMTCTTKAKRARLRSGLFHLKLHSFSDPVHIHEYLLETGTLRRLAMTTRRSASSPRRRANTVCTHILSLCVPMYRYMLYIHSLTFTLSHIHSQCVSMVITTMSMLEAPEVPGALPTCTRARMTWSSLNSKRPESTWHTSRTRESRLVREDLTAPSRSGGIKRMDYGPATLYDVYNEYCVF